MYAAIMSVLNHDWCWRDLPKAQAEVPPVISKTMPRSCTNKEIAMAAKTKPDVTST